MLILMIYVVIHLCNTCVEINKFLTFHQEDFDTGSDIN